VGTDNKIKVADQELQRAVIMEAQKYPGQEKQVFDYFSKNPHTLEGLRAPIFEDKVVDFILEMAEVTEVTVTPEELMAE
ncbi:MAG TPA: trigger factor, partial [Rhodospirillaceae bacterium]|nr:trigger factor [Rhodospirillaceae bacterium]